VNPDIHDHYLRLVEQEQRIVMDRLDH